MKVIIFIHYFQDDIDSQTDESRKKQLPFNIEKCNVISFSSGENKFHFQSYWVHRSESKIWSEVKIYAPYDYIWFRKTQDFWFNI